MSAFQPIAPLAATDLFAAVGLHDGMTLIASLAEANLIKAYARYTERVQPSGARETVRDKRIPAEMWRRIISEGRVEDVLSGTVRLDGSTDFGGGPKITLIGIRFDPDTVGKAAADHGPDLPKMSPRKVQPSLCASSVDPEAEPETSPRRIRPAASPDAKLLTVEETMTELGIGRTKLYELLEAEDLEKVKVDRATRVTRESLDRYIARLRGN